MKEKEGLELKFIPVHVFGKTQSAPDGAAPPTAGSTPAPGQRPGPMETPSGGVRVADYIRAKDR
jgi:hypothetical protein